MGKGQWIDSKTGKVVSSQPEEGVQLISPNVEPNPDDERAVENAKKALAGDSDDKTVTTKSASKADSK
jgi:hypothetical protein